MEVETHPYPALLSDESDTVREVFSPRLNALLSPKGVFKGTREEWLEASALILGTMMNNALNRTTRVTYNRKKDASKIVVTGVSLKRYLADTFGGKPSDYVFKFNKVRYSCSLQDSGFTHGGSLAHIHYSHATGNKFDEIRMGVQLGGRKNKDDSCRVADVLLHEMIHHMAGARAGHKGAFSILARTFGLKGKLTATTASQELRTYLWDEVVTTLGKYPHNAVHLTPRGQRGKGSRSIKVQCPSCEFTMRTTRLWIDKACGVLTCPIGCSETLSHHEENDEGIVEETLIQKAQVMIVFGYKYEEETNEA